MKTPNLTTDGTDNTDLHGSKIRVIRVDPW
jgi:hypothetical protein